MVSLANVFWHRDIMPSVQPGHTLVLIDVCGEKRRFTLVTEKMKVNSEYPINDGGKNSICV